MLISGWVYISLSFPRFRTVFLVATAPGVRADIPATEGRDEVTPEFRQEAYSSKRISEEKRKNNTEKKSMCEPLLEYYYKIK